MKVIGQNSVKYEMKSKIRIICPYRKQVTETNKFIGKSEIEVVAIYKFQGRENNTIIFTTIVKNINPFMEDATLINVAVSRSVKELIV